MDTKETFEMLQLRHQLEKERHKNEVLERQLAIALNGLEIMRDMGLRLIERQDCPPIILDTNAGAVNYHGRQPEDKPDNAPANAWLLISLMLGACLGLAGGYALGVGLCS